MKQKDAIPQKVAVAAGRVAYKAIEELITFQERIAELEKDAARYRWLRDRSHGQYTHPIVVSQTIHERGVVYVGPMLGDGLDTAIDNAMKGET